MKVMGIPNLKTICTTNQYGEKADLCDLWCQTLSPLSQWWGKYFYPETLADYETNPDPFYELVAIDQIDNGETANHRNADQPQTLAEYRLNLPPEYNEWLAQQSIASLINPNQTIVTLPTQSLQSTALSDQSPHSGSPESTPESNLEKSTAIDPTAKSNRNHSLRIVAPRDDDYFILDRFMDLLVISNLSNQNKLRVIAITLIFTNPC
jgi:hypothetical protein